MSISNNASSAFQEYLHELRNVCGDNEVLPKSCILSSSLLAIGLPLVSGSAHEGTFDGVKVRIRRIIVYPNEDPRTFKMVRFNDTFTHVWILNNFQAFRQMVVVWKNLSHPNIVPSANLVVTYSLICAFPALIFPRLLIHAFYLFLTYPHFLLITRAYPLIKYIK